MKARKYSTYMAFDIWRANQGMLHFGSHFWPQVTYDANNGKPFLLVFEKCADRVNQIKWPVNAAKDLRGVGLPVINIDFTGATPALETGQAWDFLNFHNELSSHLGRTVRHDKTITNVPTSFWDYRLASWPSENKTCDIDSLELSTNKQVFFGIEATRFNQSAHSHQDAVKYLLTRVFLGRPQGFNTLQLKSQIWTLTMLGGSMYLVLHHNQADGSLSENSNALFLKINREVFDEVPVIVNNAKISDEQVDIFLRNSTWGNFLAQYQHLMSQ